MLYVIVIVHSVDRQSPSLCSVHCAVLATGNYKKFARIRKIFFIIHNLVQDQVSL